MNIRELAKIIGVSPATISIVLNNKPGVGEETRNMVREAIEKYGYSASAKRKRQRGNVLLLKYWKSSILIEENQGFVSMIIDGIEEQLRKQDFSMTMMVSKSDLAGTIHEIDYDKYCGMIIIGTEIPRDMYPILQDISIPFVVVDNTVPNFQYNSVCMNNDENVYLALKYVKECGHSEIGYLRSAIDCENFAERNLAFIKYGKEIGLRFTKENEIKLTPSLAQAYEDMTAFLHKKKKLVKCFFADNDTIALGAIKALKENGYKIPADISVIGFDDIPFASVGSPALTTVHVQRDLMGRQTVTQLVQLIEFKGYESMKTQITGRLVIRGSVKKL